ncbi:unnamed protein product [Caenorhabditis nigoni]
MKFRGILLHINEHYVTFLDCEKQREIQLRNTYEKVEDKAIGKVYIFRDKRMFPQNPNNMEKLVEVEERNGEVFLKTFVLTPTAEVQDATVFATPRVSERVCNRYRECVWSPQIGMVHDPRNLVDDIRRYNPGEYALVWVKYRHGREEVFRVVEGIRRDEYTGPDRISPWHKEENGVDIYHERAMEIKEIASRNGLVPIERRTIFSPSIYVAKKVLNPLYNPDKLESPKYCDIMYNIELGIIRCVQGAGTLGCWYQHGVKDQRLNVNRVSRIESKESVRRVARGQNYRNKPTFVSVKAALLQRITSPIRALDDGKEVELPVSFRFDRKMFEEEEDHSRPRDERRIKANVHFWDEVIGKVDIPHRESLQIVQNADHIRDETRRRTIIVKVYVKLVDNYIERAQMVKDPMVAFFKVHHVRGFYNKRNRMIQNVLNFN